LAGTTKSVRGPVIRIRRCDDHCRHCGRSERDSFLELKPKSCTLFALWTVLGFRTCGFSSTPDSQHGSDMIQRPSRINVKAFAGSTRTEALERATQWWASQGRLRQVGKWEISAGHDPAPQHAHQWVVTITYEEDFE
jgi:hypothetical protein